jgi:hypothetical protein
VLDAEVAVVLRLEDDVAVEQCLKKRAIQDFVLCIATKSFEHVLTGQHELFKDLHYGEINLVAIKQVT